jgi:predicted dithiol-disulfide oxidoreductase (DUF899 family)
MFDPGWDAGCPSCAAASDELPLGLLARLRAADTAFAMVSMAPFSKIMAYKARKGGAFPWYSSLGSDFNYDFHVTLDETVAPVMYDYQSKQEILGSGSPNDLIAAGQPVEIPASAASCKMAAASSTPTRSMTAVSNRSAARAASSNSPRLAAGRSRRAPVAGPVGQAARTAARRDSGLSRSRREFLIPGLMIR